MLSGSYDGPLFLFRGDGKGDYALPTKLVSKDGSELQLDNATSVSLYDWDKDGKPDLFVGTISGPVWYVPNLGGGKVGRPVRLASPDGPMDSPDGGPCAVDWDKDGTVDLFLGSDTGRLLYYHGVKGGDAPTFDRPLILLPELAQIEADPVRPLPGQRLDWPLKRPMMRPKPTALDWDHDGKLDLLVGDFCLLEERPRAMSESEAKTFTALRKEQDALKARSAGLVRDLTAATFKKLGWPETKAMTSEESQKFSEAYQALYDANPEAVKTDKRLLEIFDQLAPLMPETGYHGFVWLFRHK